MKDGRGNWSELNAVAAGWTPGVKECDDNQQTFQVENNWQLATEARCWQRHHNYKKNIKSTKTAAEMLIWSFVNCNFWAVTKFSAATAEVTSQLPNFYMKYRLKKENTKLPKRLKDGKDMKWAFYILFVRLGASPQCNIPHKCHSRGLFCWNHPSRNIPYTSLLKFHCTTPNIRNLFN